MCLLYDEIHQERQSKAPQSQTSRNCTCVWCLWKVILITNLHWETIFRQSIWVWNLFVQTATKYLSLRMALKTTWGYMMKIISTCALIVLRALYIKASLMHMWHNTQERNHINVQCVQFRCSPSHKILWPNSTQIQLCYFWDNTEE